MTIQPERIANLSDRRPARGQCVVYWMQASQRAECNHALEYAIQRANEVDVPLVAYFGLKERYPEANARHFMFMLEGLREVGEALRERGIALIVRRESPEKGILEIAKRASLVVVDRDYLRLGRAWRRLAAERLACPLIQVETNVIVPVEEASPKEEFSAATFRPKIMKKLGRYMAPLRKGKPRRSSLGVDLPSLELSHLEETVGTLHINRGAAPVEGFRGGAGEAARRLRDFIDRKLADYRDLRNDPNADCQSGMSPYLHFGHISPLTIALEVAKRGGPAAEAYLEELVVRRELAVNFVYYNERYDSFDGLPRWAKENLLEHAKDRRPYVYDFDTLEDARTHDPYWNAAQNEMRFTGKMHGYMRMYWGKKIIEWSRTPREACETALRLNNKYELDGRDANGFAGVAWCFGKHDRPWARRPIFGSVRYMNESGLERKFDVDEYVKRVRRFGTASAP